MTLTMTLTTTLCSQLKRLVWRDRPASRGDGALDETHWLWKLLIRIRPDRPPSST